MANENVKLSGMDELVETIKNFGAFAKHANPFIRNAIDKGAEVIADEATKNANSIRSQEDGPHIADNITIQRTRITKDGKWLARVGVKKAAFHANPVEYGHILRTNKGYKFIAARPYFAPAWESKRNVAMADIEYELRRSMPEIMAKIAKKKVRAAKK